MNIREHKYYPKVLKGIALDIKENQISSLALGRNGIINHWINNAKEVLNHFSQNDEKEFTEDINHIIDKIMGVEFK